MSTENLVVEFSNIIKGVDGAEGPVFDKNGDFYMVAPERTENKAFAGEIVKVDLENCKATCLCRPSVEGNGGVPAGCQVDQDNNIWIADMRLGILMMDTSGKFQQMFRCDSEDRVMQGCNDCIFDYQGTLWVTAPAGEIAPAPYTRSSEEPFGSVYCLPKGGKPVRIDSGLLFPNGIAVLHSAEDHPEKLIVAETHTKTLWQYDILEPGKVGERSKWGTLPGDHHGGPDGMDFDAENNLIVANWGSGHLDVFSKNGGVPFLRIKCPFEKPSNVHFKPGTNVLYVTEHDTNGLWKFEWKYKGKRQYCEL